MKRLYEEFPTYAQCKGKIVEVRQIIGFNQVAREITDKELYNSFKEYTVSRFNNQRVHEILKTSKEIVIVLDNR